MRGLQIARLGLYLRLFLMRCGAVGLAAAVLVLIGTAACAWAVPHLRQQGAQLQAALDTAQKSLRDPTPTTAATAAPVSQPEQRLQQFYDVLGESRYVEQQVKTLFALSAKNGLTLAQAEYKFAYNKGGKFHSYTIALPVKGPYAAIRPFCEQVLLAIPFASLDAVDFKRDTVGNPTIDAKLHFTLFVDNGIGTIETGGNDVSERAESDR